MKGKEAINEKAKKGKSYLVICHSVFFLASFDE